MTQEEEREARIAQIMAEADRIVEEVLRQLDDAGDFYRRNGIDREKLSSAMSEKEREKAKAEATRLAAEDLAEIEREVAALKNATRPAFSSKPRRGAGKLV